MLTYIDINIKDIYYNGIRFSEFINGTDYYKFFRTMMEKINTNEKYDFTKSEYFELCMTTTDNSLIEAATYKAYIINLANIYNCNHNDAANIRDLLQNQKIIKFDNIYEKDKSKAIMVLIENYIDILKKVKNNNYVEPLIGIIDKCGRFNIVEGIHRTLIYKICKIKTIRVMIINRDDNWVDFIKFFENESITLYKKPLLLYQPIYHPDFQNFGIIRNEDRMEPIYQNLIKINSNIETGLDLGCFIGANSHYLARKGIEMDAIEYEEKYYRAACTLNCYYNLDVMFVHDNVYSFIEKIEQNKKYDFILILSLAYHLYRNDKQKATQFLKKLKDLTKIIIIDDEPSTKILLEEDIRNIYDNNCKIEKIFTGTDNRNIYFIA